MAGILVAALTAISAIVVAVIGLQGKDDPDKKPAAGLNEVVSVTASASAKGGISALIKSVRLSTEADGSRLITVSGSLDGLSAAALQYVRAFAQPVDANNKLQPQAAEINPQQDADSVYLSGPVTLRADGSWEAVIKISPVEARDISVCLGMIDAPVPVAPTPAAEPPLASPPTDQSVHQPVNELLPPPGKEVPVIVVDPTTEEGQQTLETNPDVTIIKESPRPSHSLSVPSGIIIDPISEPTRISLPSR